jgi:hypothetical protein
VAQTSREIERDPAVVSTIRFYYEVAVALALMAVVAIVSGLIAAVISGGSPPNLPVATIAFVLTGGYMFCRLRRNRHTAAHDS